SPFSENTLTKNSTKLITLKSAKKLLKLKKVVKKDEWIRRRKKKRNNWNDPSSARQSCLDKNWILQFNQPEQFEPFTYMDEIPVVDENCLEQFLKINPNSCPIQPHDNFIYFRCGVAKRFIGNLKIICPLQFQQDLQERQQRNEKVICDFKGKIKDLSNHLDNDCTLQRSDCRYKQFGCEHSCPKHKLSDHLSSQSKLHFDLTVKFIQTLQLNEKNLKLTNENITLKKENEQLQQEMKTIQKESQQELLKLHADIEIIKNNFIQKEKQYNGLTKSLQGNNDKLSNKKEEDKNDDIEEFVFNLINFLFFSKNNFEAKILVAYSC
ncbi:hypothetical protein RFI_38409, partial [Reticulomyxa filosa]